MNKFIRTGLIGALITLVLVVILGFFSIPLIGTSPLFLVWGTLILIGITRKKKS